MDWGGGGVSEPVQAILTVNALLDAFCNGVSKTYLYELMDGIANPSSTDLEDSFGLFKADGTPKLAATAIHNLTKILADPSSMKFQPDTLLVTVSGLPATGRWLAFEKSSGAFDLVIWNEPQIWNEANRSQVAPSSVMVTVSLGNTRTLVKVFDPMSGTSPTMTLSNVSSVELFVRSDPYVFELEPELTP